MTQRHRLIAAAALVLLAGCAAAPATRYYVLNPTAPAPAAAQGAARAAPESIAVVIKEVRLPQYLDRREIVIRGGDHQLRMVENEQWAGNLREDMTRVLADNLGRFLESERVVAAPHRLKMQPDFRVEVEVLRFEREAGGRVGLAARWWLTQGADATLLASPEITLSGAPLGAGASYEAVVASMSSVYGELAQAIARSIRSQQAGRS